MEVALGRVGCCCEPGNWELSPVVGGGGGWHAKGGKELCGGRGGQRAPGGWAGEKLPVGMVKWVSNCGHDNEQVSGHLKASGTLAGMSCRRCPSEKRESRQHDPTGKPLGRDGPLTAPSRGSSRQISSRCALLQVCPPPGLPAPAHDPCLRSQGHRCIGRRSTSRRWQGGAQDRAGVFVCGRQGWPRGLQA